MLGRSFLFRYDKEGKYQINVSLTDAAGTTVTKSLSSEVIDQPFVISEFYTTTLSDDFLSGMDIAFMAATENDSLDADSFITFSTIKMTKSIIRKKFRPLMTIISTENVLPLNLYGSPLKQDLIL